MERRTAFIAGAVLASGTILAGVLFLGAWAYDTRRLSLHHARLSKVLAQAPTADRLTRGLVAEGSPLVTVATSADEVERAAREWGGRRREEILAKAKAFASVRVHRAGDVVYFLFFDEAGVLKDFVCVA